MDATAVISLIAIGLSLATFIVIRLNRADEISDDLAYGDYPAIPREMATVRKPRGDKAASDSGRTRTINGSHSHRGKASTR